jgi:chitinase
MKLNLQKFSMALLSLLPAVNAFSASGSSNVVLYWGLASAGSQESLGTYCESTSADMYVLSFLAGFPESRLTIHGCAGTLDSSCPDLAADIKYCQSLGKKVLLSLGGAVGSYGFTSDQQAINYASTLWNSFGGGQSTQRPFGDVVLDGFDLDIENGNPTGYAALTTALKKLYAGGNYYIGAAPQCVYPDASLSTALAYGYFDFVFVQFYNNRCSIDGSFNWATWEKYAAEYAASTNPNVKLYLGLAGSSSAASSGYVSISSIKSVLATIQSSKFFGGVMVWDASQAFSNVVNGASFAASLKALLTSGSSNSDTVAAVSSLASSVAVSKVSSTAVNKLSTSAATATVVYNEWGYPVVVTPSSSAVANQWGAAASSTALVNEWGTPVSSSSVANEWAASSSSSVVNNWNAPVSSVVNEWAASSSSSVVNNWNAPVSSVVNEWAAAATTTVLKEAVQTTVVAVEAAVTSASQWSGSTVQVDNGLWNPDTSVKPDDGYWKAGKYEGETVNKIVVANSPAKREDISSSTVSSASSSSLPKSSSVASSSKIVSSLVSTSSNPISTFASPSSKPISTSTSAGASSSAVALSSTSVAVESISSSAPATSDAAVESTHSLIISTITITSTASTAIPTVSSVSSIPKSTFFSSFTTVRSAAPEIFSSAEASAVASTSVVPVFSNTVIFDTTEIASASSASTEVATNTVTATSASQSTSQSVTNSLKVVDSASVPEKCNDSSQGHLDNCLNTLFETENKAVELVGNDITDSNASAALPEVGEITLADPTSSDKEQNDDDLTCTKEGAVTCKDGKFAMCNFNKWILFSCPALTTCKALTISDIETVVGCNWI